MSEMMIMMMRVRMSSYRRSGGARRALTVLSAGTGAWERRTVGFLPLETNKHIS